MEESSAYIFKHYLNLNAQVIHKRRVAMAKAQGNLSGAIEWLNKYLEM